MYEELVKRLRSAESNYQETLDCLSEAADAIERLSMKLHGDEAAIAGMKREIERMVVSGNKPRWIPVTERLPEQKKLVLVTGIEAIGNVRIYGVKQLDGDVWRPTSAPSCYWEHWMPLPEPPKEETK